MAEVSFGEWLKRRRKAAGWTQEQLALQIHCSTSALRKIEAEVRRPSREIIERLAEIFNIPQEEQKSFQRFARGDPLAFSGGNFEEAPWHTAHRQPRTNLPTSTTSFIGREKEQKEIIDLIARNRVVSLTGAGGIGKTRLALETAQQALTTFPDGLWFIEFAPLSDLALVPQVVVTTLGLIEQANRPPLTILTDFLRSKRALLILDNCEHLIQACAQLAEALLRACPDLHILATSREALGIGGETVYLVPSLTTPDPLHASLEKLPDYESVQLFIERAQTAMPAFSITSDNGSAIAQICRQLDGIPLALELAAARVKVLRVEEVATRLDDRFRLLTSGARTALPRHQTLEAMIDWSHDLLSESEGVLFRRLSVFAGGWSLEGAESVCAGDRMERGEILNVLTQLFNKSIVIAEREQGQETRYRMLETIREYAREKLWAAGEGEMIRQRHLNYFVDLAERAEPNLRARDMVQWLDRLEAELDNIRVALDWAQESDIEAQLRVASALLWFWHIRGHKNEGIDWLERGLSIEAMERGGQPIVPSRAMIRGKALNASGVLLALTMEEEKARSYLEESLALFQELGPAGKQGMAYALSRLGGLISADNQGRTMLETSLELFRELGDKFGMAECLTLLLVRTQNEEDYKQALRLAEEQLALRREIGDLDGTAIALGDSAILYFLVQNDYQRSITLFEESLARVRAVGNKWALGFLLSFYGDMCMWQGDYERATRICKEAIAFAQEIAERPMVASRFYSLGTIAWFEGNYASATQMVTDSLAMFREVGVPWLVASSLHALGGIALAQGDEERAAQLYESELTYCRVTELNESIIFALDGFGKSAWSQGLYELAQENFESALRMSQDTDLKPAICRALYGLGRVAQSQGDYAGAHTFYVNILEIQHQRINFLYKWSWITTYGFAIAYPLEALAVIASAQNKLERGARLFGAAEALYTPLRFEMSARERAEHDQAIAAARAELGEEAFAKAWAEGQKMTLDEAVAYALKED